MLKNSHQAKVRDGDYERLDEQMESVAHLMSEIRIDSIGTQLARDVDMLRNAGVKQDPEFKKNLEIAYYNDEISFDRMKSLFSHDEAETFKVLKNQLNKDYMREVRETEE